MMILPVLLLATARQIPLDANRGEDARLAALARASIVSEVSGAPLPTIDRRTTQAPVFVTIEIRGAVRGCRGDLRAQTRSIEDEIVHAARAACRHDPRYRPISKEELKDFKVTVTIVDRTEPMTSIASLTPDQGVVVRNGSRIGIVLPWEGKDPRTRLKWGYRKAGLPEGSPAQISVLFARRFQG
jgi:AMMECR1 domain-containing protein